MFGISEEVIDEIKGDLLLDGEDSVDAMFAETIVELGYWARN